MIYAGRLREDGNSTYRVKNRKFKTFHLKENFTLVIQTDLGHHTQISYTYTHREMNLELKSSYLANNINNIIIMVLHCS